MKKSIIFTLLMFGSFASFSQDLIKEIQKLTLVNDSLQRQVIKPLNDSLFKSKINHNNELAKLSNKIMLLELEKSDLNKKNKTLETSIIECNKTKLKTEKDILQVKVDSLTLKINELNKSIAYKDLQINQVKELSIKTASIENEKGKQEVLNKIIQSYKLPLNEIITKTNLNLIERDMLILGDKTEIQGKLVSLQKYFISEMVLNEKYNEQKVATAIIQLKLEEQTELIIKLITKLENYKIYNEGFKSTLNKVIEIDKIFSANDDNAQTIKFNDILVNFSEYFRGYRFNFNDYPYLSEMVLEIIKLKQKDADTDISKYPEKL